MWGRVRKPTFSSFRVFFEALAGSKASAEAMISQLLLALMLLTDPLLKCWVCAGQNSGVVHDWCSFPLIYLSPAKVLWEALSQVPVPRPCSRNMHRTLKGFWSGTHTKKHNIASPLNCSSNRFHRLIACYPIPINDVPYCQPAVPINIQSTETMATRFLQAYSQAQICA